MPSLGHTLFAVAMASLGLVDAYRGTPIAPTTVSLHARASGVNGSTEAGTNLASHVFTFDGVWQSQADDLETWSVSNVVNDGNTKRVPYTIQIEDNIGTASIFHIDYEVVLSIGGEVPDQEVGGNFRYAHVFGASHKDLMWGVLHSPDQQTFNTSWMISTLSPHYNGDDIHTIGQPVYKPATKDTLPKFEIQGHYNVSAWEFECPVIHDKFQQGNELLGPDCSGKLGDYDIIVIQRAGDYVESALYAIVGKEELGCFAEIGLSGDGESKGSVTYIWTSCFRKEGDDTYKAADDEIDHIIVNSTLTWPKVVKSKKAKSKTAPKKKQPPKPTV